MRPDYRNDKPFRPRTFNNDHDDRLPHREPRTFNNGSEFGRGRGIGVRGGMRRPFEENQRFNKPFDGRRGGMGRSSGGNNLRNED